MRYRDLRGVLASSVAVMAVAVATPAMAQIRSFDIPAQSAATGIPALAKQADIQLLVSSAAVTGKKIRAIRGQMTVDEAIRRAVGDADLQIVNSDGRTYTLAPRERRRTTSMLEMPAMRAVEAQNQAAPQYDEIIVTAQKKEERITDVPIAMSAFSAEALDDYKIEGGSELLRAVPNVTFSKTNFASYNFSIRGIGTKALAASTDPAVAISFNNAPMIRNRLFEQEYYDVERVEVLRGPQGTLYGRNATGGVVNMITTKPKMAAFDGLLKAEIGDYNTRRLGGMINIPISDTIAIRAAGAMTQRDGFDFNLYTNQRVNDRDLWSTRISAGWEPSERFSATLIWEHFKEDDSRSRTGKQLCSRDDGPAMIGSTDISTMLSTRGALSQGCLPQTIYNDAAFGVPNGLSMAHVITGNKVSLGRRPPGSTPAGVVYLMNSGIDPYAGLTQSRNLREINTQFDPDFRAGNDVYQLNLQASISDSISLHSQSMYTEDRYYSTQDYYRFVSNPVFNNSKGLNATTTTPNVWIDGPTPGGVATDYQLGASDRILGLDMVRSKSNQYYQEIRMGGELSDRTSFNFGGNYTLFKIDEDYFVFNNLFTIFSEVIFNSRLNGRPPVDCASATTDYTNCLYVDKNPLTKIDGDGHNYFRSRNKSKTESYALFGEAYHNISDDVKVTAGLRYTHDKKTGIPYLTQLLLAPGATGAGLIGRGLQREPDVVQSWGRMTGRFVIDWKPVVDGFSDALVYASYSRGYKGGGANPPAMGINRNRLKIYENPDRFGPESVDAIELGFKGASLGGGLNLGLSGFYYSYRGYQISQIVDRIALNENFDATMYGMDLDASLVPTRNLRLNLNLGLLKTKIGSGAESIDVMNRTQGNKEYTVVKPWVQLASNCVVPTATVEKLIKSPFYGNDSSADIIGLLCGGNYLGDFLPGSLLSNLYGVSYDPSTGPNGGRGFFAPLAGNELPNAPHWTASFGLQYEIPIDQWSLKLRADHYIQGKSWSRVYNTEIDRIKSWSNTNISFSIESLNNGILFDLYVKNIFNKTPITDIFLNSDDSALTANVFTLDPRIMGFSVRKSF